MPRQYNLGVCYHYGYGAKPDAEAAYTCYLTAAEQGFDKAMVLVGLFYEHGLHVAQDLKTAAKWYRKAVALGNAEAVRMLEEVENG